MQDCTSAQVLKASCRPVVNQHLVYILQASNLPAVVASKLPRVSESGAAVGEAMEHALENVGESLTQFGKSLFVGTQVLLEQV